MNTLEQALTLLPQELCIDAPQYIPEELRLRMGRVPTALYNGSERAIGPAAVSREAIQKTVERATGASMHSHLQELRRGYINYHGIRIGICGEAVVQSGEVTGFRSISSLDLRLPREMRGVCGEVLDTLRKSGVGSTLIISPPGGGKTTALRELIRCLSNDGYRISVVDERCELSAADSGREGFDLGRYSDVLLNVPKDAGAMMLLRSMNPEFIAMDEITSEVDIKAIAQITGCGVKLLATAHADSSDELAARPLYAEMLALGAFKYVVTIDRCLGSRRYTVKKL